MPTFTTQSTLLLLLAIQSRVEAVGQREVPKLVNLSLRLEGSFNR